MSEIRSERNINLNIQNIVVATYIEGRPVEIGHIFVKWKRDMLVKLCLLTGGPCGYIHLTTKRIYQIQSFKSPTRLSQLLK